MRAWYCVHAKSNASGERSSGTPLVSNWAWCVNAGTVCTSLNGLYTALANVHVHGLFTRNIHQHSETRTLERGAARRALGRARGRINRVSILHWLNQRFFLRMSSRLQISARHFPSGISLADYAMSKRRVSTESSALDGPIIDRHCALTTTTSRHEEMKRRETRLRAWTYS